MTTGTTGSFIGPNYDYRSWNGTDGKYEVVNGVKRVKFNDYTCLKATQRAVYGPGEWGTPYSVSYTTSPAGSFVMNDTVKLQSKLAAKIRTTDLHIGKFVVEGRQTIEMISTTFLTVVRAYALVRSGNAKQAAGVLSRRLAYSSKHPKILWEVLKQHRPRARSVAGRWLELQYGWLPLLSDIHSAAKKLDDDLKSVYQSSVRVSSSRTVHFEASVSPTLYTIYGLATFVQKLRYEFAEEDNVTLQRQLGLEDPAGIIWEAVPFSFVVDWFVPVSSYLDSLNILPLLKGRWVLTKVKSYGMRRLTVLPGPRFKGYYGASLEAAQINIERTHGEGFTFFNIAPPDIKPLSQVFSQPHINNAIALATQMLSGGHVSRR